MIIHAAACSQSVIELKCSIINMQVSQENFGIMIKQLSLQPISFLILTKLELIRIIAHLTAGIFIVAENSETGSEGLYLLLSSHKSVHGLSCVYDMLSK